jgi:capsular exopolysaccharide synthesis family protein
MEVNNNTQYQNYTSQYSDLDEDEAGFDILEWLFKILHHWYLFVIALAISLSIAFLANKTWKPTYQVSARVILGGGSQSGSQQVVMQGVNLNTAYKNNDNQMIMFTSNDLVERAINKINANVDYYTTGHFKVSNLYGYAPIEIKGGNINNAVYGLEFDFKDIDGLTYEISHAKDKQLDGFRYTGRYGMLLNTPYFSVVVNKTANFEAHKEINFAFLSNSYLIDYFTPRISLSFVTQNSTVLAVSLVGTVYPRDIDFLNALCDEFLLDNLNRKNEEANRTILFIDKQLSGISDSLKMSDSQLQHFRRAKQIVDINAYGSTILGHLTSYEERRLQYNLKESYLNYLADYIKKNANDQELLTPSSLGIVDPVLTGLLTQYNETLHKLQQTTPQNPFYAKYQDELGKIRGSLSEALHNVRAAFAIEKRDIDAQTHKASGELATLPDIESQMNNFERQFKMNDTYYTYLLQKRAEAQIQRASNVPDNTILERARMVSITNGGDKQKSMMMALVLGLIIPLLIIILKEYLKTKVMDKRDVEKISPFPYVGSIPHAVNDTSISVLRRPKSAIAEAYRMIRTRVKFVARQMDASCVIVTSTESGDGKTHFCLNYASMCAMTGESTILVDMDLRKPSVSKRLLLENEKGITNCMLGQVSLDDAIIKRTPEINFDMLLAGTVPPNPGEMIRSSKMQELVNELKKRYHYVIIDTSPVGIVSDAYPLAPLADCLLYVVRSKKTNKKFFKTVIRQLKTDRIQYVGMVLNDVDTKVGGYGYNYGYQRYGYGNYGNNPVTKDYIKEYYDEE